MLYKLSFIIRTGRLSQKKKTTKQTSASEIYPTKLLYNIYIPVMLYYRYIDTINPILYPDTKKEENQLHSDTNPPHSPTRCVQHSMRSLTRLLTNLNEPPLTAQFPKETIHSQRHKNAKRGQ